MSARNGKKAEYHIIVLVHDVELKLMVGCKVVLESKVSSFPEKTHKNVAFFNLL